MEWEAIIYLIVFFNKISYEIEFDEEAEPDLMDDEDDQPGGGEDPDNADPHDDTGNRPTIHEPCSRDHQGSAGGSSVRRDRLT